MNIGIVGCAADKFTPQSAAAAQALIKQLLQPDARLVSGGCHLGGIDIWAEETARAICTPEPLIFLPRKHQWSGGYRERNLKIANNSDILHVIVVDKYPPGYTGIRFSMCYHCKTTTHIKSGGCWTGLHARHAIWHIIYN